MRQGRSDRLRLCQHDFYDSITVVRSRASITFPWVPSVIPFGPQLFSGTTPTLATGSHAPMSQTILREKQNLMRHSDNKTQHDRLNSEIREEKAEYFCGGSAPAQPNVKHISAADVNQELPPNDGIGTISRRRHLLVRPSLRASLQHPYSKGRRRGAWARHEPKL
jgi:hypothetical protein